METGCNQLGFISS